MTNLAELMPLLILLLSLILFLSIGGLMLFRIKSEAAYSRLVGVGMLLIFASSIYNLILTLSSGPIIIHLASWYHIGHHSFSFVFDNNFISALYASVFMLVIAVVGLFSSTYMHQDEDYFEFFLIYPLFSFSVLLTVFSHNLDTLFVGWELIGITSVLLIGFYKNRTGPLKNSLYTLIHYRVGELTLLGAMTMLHIQFDGSDFELLKSGVASKYALILIYVSCLVKSAQWPFGSWLPRAMEGPTPSSAIFYGGISTSLGPMLLIKLMTSLQQYPDLGWWIASGGLITALYASSVGRTIPDIKGQLSYATIAQIGIIYGEVGLGFYEIAIYHSLIHCLVRTFQYLKSPSIINDYQQLNLQPPKISLEKILPISIRKKLFIYARSGYYLEDLIIILIVKPFFNLAKLFHNIEQKIAGEKGDHITGKNINIHSLKEKSL